MAREAGRTITTKDVVISRLVVLNDIVYLLMALMLVLVTRQEADVINEGVDTMSAVPRSTR